VRRLVCCNRVVVSKDIELHQVVHHRSTHGLLVAVFDLHCLQVIAERVRRECCQKHIFWLEDLKTYILSFYLLEVILDLLHDFKTILLRHLEIKQHQRNRSNSASDTPCQTFFDHFLRQANSFLAIAGEVCHMQCVPLIQQISDRFYVKRLIISNDNPIVIRIFKVKTTHTLLHSNINTLQLFFCAHYAIRYQHLIGAGVDCLHYFILHFLGLAPLLSLANGRKSFFNDLTA
jgi:hypothetical protein